MSAFGTKKQGADFAQQLTFPAVFSEAVEQSGVNPFGYYPASQQNPVILPMGDDIQAKYHQQKMMDAHRRVMNAVADNRASTARFLKSHQNYIVPKPVLSQRQFANPSSGNQADIYSHRPIQWEVNWDNLYGGVLFTQQSQKWGRQKLQDRIAQLDAINQAKQEFLTGTPMVDATAGVPSGVEEFPVGSKVELIAVLQSISTSVEAGKVSALTLSDSIKFLRLLFRWATTASLDEIEEVLESVENIIESLQDIEDEFEEGVAQGRQDIEEYNANLLEQMRRVYQYLKGMVGAVNKLPKERQKVSSNLIKTLGFTSLTKKSAEALKEAGVVLSAKASRMEANRLQREAEEKFDKAPRDELADRSGQYLGEASSASSSSTDSFRNSKSAELPVEEAKSAEPAFSDDMKQPEQKRKVIPMEEFRKRGEEASKWRPDWLNRQALLQNSDSTSTLVALAKRVNEEGKRLFGEYYVSYKPLASSKRQSILSSFKKRFNI